MTFHAENTLRSSGIAEILDLAFAVSAAEARRTERLLPRKDSQVLDLVATGATAVGAVVADQRAITEK